ncbi:unnamed protein product, partial [Strongylus vulgaris]
MQFHISCFDVLGNCHSAKKVTLAINLPLFTRVASSCASSHNRDYVPSALDFLRFIFCHGPNRLQMHDHARWLDVLYPPSINAAPTIEASPPNAARDSLRALLLLTLFALTFASAMARMHTIIFICFSFEISYKIFLNFQLATVLRGEWARNHIASFISCIGGGVFLATCLLDLLPEALESYEKAGFESNFPVAEAAVAGGLLMVLAIEQVVLEMQDRGYLVSGHLHSHNNEDDRQLLAHSSSVTHEEDTNPTLGVCLLVLALSLHALFEGLSLAVITDATKLLEVAIKLISRFWLSLE